MRIPTTAIAIASVATLGLLSACEVQGGLDGFPYPTPTGHSGGATDPGATDPGATDPGDLDPGYGEPQPAPEPTKYYAVFIEDDWDARCATSGVGAHGADIDAVGLWDPTLDPDNPELIGWLDVVDMELDRATCDTYGFADPDLAIGPPDGELTEGFYSLAGGWLIGEFDHQVEILPHYIITVHEIDDTFCEGLSWCVGSEGYSVSIATDLDCVNTGPDFRDTCMVPVTGPEGAEGSTVLPLDVLETR